MTTPHVVCTIFPAPKCCLGRKFVSRSLISATSPQAAVYCTGFAPLPSSRSTLCGSAHHSCDLKPCIDPSGLFPWGSWQFLHGRCAKLGNSGLDPASFCTQHHRIPCFLSLLQPTFHTARPLTPRTPFWWSNWTLPFFWNRRETGQIILNIIFKKLCKVLVLTSGQIQ